MGAVYRARDAVLGRTVALKVLRDHDPAFLARFKTEAMNAARLSHHNIVAVYDYGEADDGRPFIAMEYVSGQTLRDIMISGGALRPDHAAGIASQVARALEHAHRAGIIHRDIKPENVLVATDGTVKVADFGLSRAEAESHATSAGTVIGTAQYLAPEQVSRGAADARSDIYALGIVLYEMLTGAPAFGGETPIAIAYKHINEDVPSPSDVNPSVPRALDAIVLHATARDPDERYPNAGSFADALRSSMSVADTAALRGLVHHTESIPLDPEHTDTVMLRGPESPPRPRFGKRRIVAAGTVLAMLLAFIGVTTYLHVKVPEVAGLTQDDAELLLKRAGLSAHVVPRHDAVVETGRVIEQKPAAHANARRWSSVTLFISTGPELAVIPDVRGKTFDAAEEALNTAGFANVVREDAFSSTVAKGKVVGQEPAAKLKVTKDSQITLTVSKGAEMASVPNVVGKQREVAISELQLAGFKTTVKEQETLSKPEGEVLDQSPDGGARLAKGSKVGTFVEVKNSNITVAKSPPLRKVPDLRCMTRGEAEDAIVAAGFQPAFDGNGRYVVDQSPTPGEKVPKGSVVTATMRRGSFC